jgi:hypothetical protein
VLSWFVDGDGGWLVILRTLVAADGPLTWDELWLACLNRGFACPTEEFEVGMRWLVARKLIEGA